MPRSTFLTSRRFRFLLQLAWLAMLAQAGLGFVSAGHQARMLAAGGAGLDAVCTPDGLVYLDSDGSPAETPASGLSGGPQCAVCAAAVLLPLVATFDPGPDPLYGGGPFARPREVPASHATRFALRPPPRAPPHLS